VYVKQEEIWKDECNRNVCWECEYGDVIGGTSCGG
jgi:hypothetical protein